MLSISINSLLARTLRASLRRSAAVEYPSLWSYFNTISPSLSNDILLGNTGCTSPGASKPVDYSDAITPVVGEDNVFLLRGDDGFFDPGKLIKKITPFCVQYFNDEDRIGQPLFKGKYGEKRLKELE